MLPNKIAFVDIETTGLRAAYDRIIEIGIIRVEDNKIVQTYHSLINPQTHLPPEIIRITGITDTDLEMAPTFNSVKHDILESLVDCVFVAHNVRFDYGFLINEFKRQEISFSSRHFCTVRLSQILYPTHRKHNLDAIMQRFDIQCDNRHRALDDAKVLYHFYQKLQDTYTPEALQNALAKCFKTPSAPLKLPPGQLETLPEKPGVYMFYAKDGMPLYVGKSKNIKTRVLSHFAADIRSATEMNIAQQITSIETVTTAGEIGALFLESELIKKLLPVYNKRSRIKKELVALKSKINADGYQECYLEPITKISPHEVDTFLGFFKSRKQAKAFLTDLAKEQNLCERLLGLEKTQGECFAHRLGRCNGACIGEEKAVMYNLRFLQAFATRKVKPWPFTGAIVIEEKEFGANTDYFIVDKWCYMGKVTIDAEGNKKHTLDEDVAFDLDIYQILKQFLKKPASRKQIKSFSSISLSES